MLFKKYFENYYWKRNIFLIIILTIVALFCIFLACKESNIVLSANSTPITNHIIILDAGHGLPDEGAVGFTGTTEQAINLAIVLKLQKIIEQSGSKVVLTRSDENGIYEITENSIRNKKVSDIKNRTYIGNNNNGDVYISVHLNKYQESKYSGWQTFYQYDNDEGKKIAEVIQQEMNKNMDQKNDRKPMSLKGVYIMDNIKIPTIVIECGFLSNPEEEQKLKDSNYQNKIAWGIYIGLQRYFSAEGS